ncbi:MAG: hypothetical protein K8T26_16435 [Lentisphaerae bacterium]|nr:hypothetical protein [Lentisphaerota bacterium]
MKAMSSAAGGGIHPGWEQIQERHEAFWHGQIIDRPLIRARAGKPGVPGSAADRVPGDPERVRQWFTDPDCVIPRLERELARTHYAGDAIPMLFPVAPALVAIQAAYLGGGYRFASGTGSAWCDPIIEAWPGRQRLAFNPENGWWRLSERLLAEGERAFRGRAILGIPDLQGGGQILDLLRGTERLAADLLENPEEVLRAMAEIDVAWRDCWTACNRLIGAEEAGYVDWLEVWSAVPAVTVECDFSIMISPGMFRRFFLPSVVQQTEWVARTIYHLDGEGAIRHLDALLAVDRLNGIQWVPGAGAAPMRAWVPLLQRIQRAGKLLVLNVEPADVPVLLDALRPEGLLMDVWCESPEAADELVSAVTRRFA